MSVIGWLWLALGIVWLIASARAKPTARRQTAASRLGQVALLWCASMLLVLGNARPLGVLSIRILPASRGTNLAGIVITAAGIAFAIWARLTIGANWSGTVTVKRDHQLVVSGPYRVVRHPIYSGILLGVLGTAVAIGEIRGFVALAIGFAGFWWKSRVEESFMMAEFGEQYSAYRRHLKALIPFVL